MRTSDWDELCQVLPYVSKAHSAVKSVTKLQSTWQSRASHSLAKRWLLSSDQTWLLTVSSSITCPSIYLYVHNASIYLPTHLSILSSTQLSLYTSMRPYLFSQSATSPIHLFIILLIHPFIYAPSPISIHVYISTHIIIHLSSQPEAPFIYLLSHLPTDLPLYLIFTPLPNPLSLYPYITSSLCPCT